jgi:hypothetical protein
MAIQGPFKVNCGEQFPHGLGVIGAVSALADFDASTKENRVQARDKEAGLPLWTVEVMDFDPVGVQADTSLDDRSSRSADS